MWALASTANAYQCLFALVLSLVVANEQTAQCSMLASLSASERNALTPACAYFVDFSAVAEHQECAAVKVQVRIRFDDLFGSDNGSLPSSVTCCLVEGRLDHLLHPFLIDLQHDLFPPFDWISDRERGTTFERAPARSCDE